MSENLEPIDPTPPPSSKPKGKKKVNWDEIPVPEMDHGDMTPPQLQYMREAFHFEHHPNESRQRTKSREFMEKAPREFHQLMGRLEQDLNVEIAKAKEIWLAEQAKAEAKVEEAKVPVKRDNGTARAMELLERLLEEYAEGAV